MDPDRTVRHGRHTDYYWPGVIHSVWEWGPFRLRRERTYVDRYHQRLAKTAWQFQVSRERRRGGVRYEVDAPDSGRLS